MNCSDAHVRLRDFVAGRLPPAERDALAEHLRVCPTCAAAAVSRAHAGDDRAIWEGAGRAVARAPVLRRAEAPRRPPPALRRATPPRSARLRRAGPGAAVRSLQVCVAGLACAILAMAVPTVGRWTTLLGLNRWGGSNTVVALPPRFTSRAEPTSAPVELVEEAKQALAATLSGQEGEQFAERIAATRITLRLHEERSRPELPSWTRSALGKLEVFLLRARAAGDDAREWAFLRTLVSDARLIRSCDDLRAYFRSDSDRTRP